MRVFGLLALAVIHPSVKLASRVPCMEDAKARLAALCNKKSEQWGGSCFTGTVRSQVILGPSQYKAHAVLRLRITETLLLY